ncbi:hypothetical protein CMQ_6213 [Grosmannia clavigera kw1407]|uniref:ORP1 like protein n=1 Tax=Grosmannia clavigera (strain kw1407 / UAMH 11150) TaxID=655863 RepID=F0XLP8_GROCL|nr:uncharacterized protein CMQ_6213 [Grosmannia clavigera kw1407]EFX01271.1 hypothetical protein CMQ_6213 [Grosmannia clavigera kw1407]
MDREILMSVSSATDARARSSPEISSTEQSPSCESTPTKTSPTTGEAGPSQSRPSADIAEEAFVDFETASACMYRGDCQTGSQLRKAISHIFGRNKLCTRMIPTGVWVHYCRKHYQRTRYRNSGEYPQRQIGLVQEQVKRVQAWSDCNTRRGSGPILKDWSLSVRKREQMRLDSKLAANGKKRPFQDEGEGEEDEGFDEDRADLSGTAVPDWVISRIGDGYSTSEILTVVERLKADIDQGRLQQIPDIEILPNISTEDRSDDGTNAKRSFAKRRATGSRSNVNGAGGSGAGHRRSQSVNAAGLSENHMATRRCSQPSNTYMPPRILHNSELQQPLDKRQRIGGERADRHGSTCNSESFGSRTSLPPTGPLSRPSLGSRMQLTHRPAFGEIRESRAEAQIYQPTERIRFETTASDGNIGQQQQQQQGRGADLYEHERGYGISTAMPVPYSYGSCYDHEHQQAGPTSSRYGMLPAPNPLRHDGASVAQRLESSSYALSSAADRRGSTHQRSQSEAMSYHHMPSSHDARPTSSSGFPPLHSAPAGLGANTIARFGQDAAEKASFGYGNYQTQNNGQGGQQPYGYAKEADRYERYDNVRLPPLQTLPPPHSHSHQRYTSSAVGGGFGIDRKYRTAAEYPESARHVRHQSSPVVPRLLPSPMEIGTARRLPDLGRPLSPRP